MNKGHPVVKILAKLIILNVPIPLSENPAGMKE